MKRTRTFAGRRTIILLPVFVIFNLFITPCSAQDRRGLVAHWKFDEAKGDKLIDASGNNNHGVIHGATWTDGRVKGGLEFDGKDDYIDVPKSASLDSINKQITLMCWIKSPLTGRHSILERWFYKKGVDQRCLEMDVSGGKMINILLSANGAGGSGSISSRKVPADEWVHLAVTSDGKKIKIYMNGDPDPAISPAPDRIYRPRTNLHIGGWLTAGVDVVEWDNLFQGVMDEIRIYSRALAPEEILQNYKETSPKGTVSGKVIDINGKPISGTKVKVGLFPAVTNKAGVYKISVPTRTYEVTVSRKGYKREIKPAVKVKVGKTTEANVLLTADKTAPSISRIKTRDVASVTADVLWETDEPCLGAIRYGTSTGKYKETVKESSYTESHKVTLTGLSPETKYYLVMESTDGAKNSTTSKELVFKTQKLSGVILWDSGEIFTDKHKDFRPYKNRANWKQVPYGATGDYQFKGSAVLENEFFYIYFHYNAYDAIYMHAKVNGRPGIWVNEMYKRGGGRGHGTRYVKVVKTSPDEVIVEHQAAAVTDCVSTHRVLPGKPWVEFRAVKNIKTQGIHGKTRIDIVPQEGGNDYVIDSLRNPKKYYRPARTLKEAKMVLCLYESVDHPFLWVFTFPSLKRAKPYITCDSGHGRNTDAFSWMQGAAKVPKHWFSEPNWPRRSWGCIASTHAGFGKDLKEPVVLGALTYWHNWNREELGIPIKAGQEYKSKWKPPYPGRWRMTARVAEKKYDQGWEYDGKTVFKAKHFSKDVYDGDFTFKSPIDGVLDYVLMYMYDRTKDTPANILTPMDQYRWMMEQQK